MDDARLARRRRRRTGLWLGGGTAVLVLVSLSGAAWKIASRPTGTEGLIAQINMLVGIFSAILGLAVALSTVWYAFSTRDMVEAMEGTRLDERARSIDASVDALAAATLAVAAAAAPMAVAMRTNWRWYLPGARRTRDSLLLTYATRLESHMTEATWRAEHLNDRLGDLVRPDLDRLMDAVLHTHDHALSGRTRHATADAHQIRAAIDSLRASVRMATAR